MTRVFVLGFVLLTAACGGKSNESLCANQVPPPAACNTPCDPAPGAPNNCPGGFHCSADGKCDTLCTQGGGQCGSGNVCTADGRCEPGGSGSGSGSGEPDACPSVHATATRVTPSIQLLIDRSGSMLHDFADNTRSKNDPDPEKYATVVNALVGTQGVVTQLEASVLFGGSMFPGAQCPGLFVNPSGRKLNNKSEIEALLAAHPPDSGANTPTEESIKLAVNGFLDPNQKPPQGSPPVIVLATDGLPNNCNGDTTGAQDATVAAAADAFTNHIRLYLLSVGTKIDPDFAQRLANAGQGVQAGDPDAKPYTATDPKSLSDAFQEIVRGVAPCDIMLSGHVDADAAATGVVTINGAPITFGTDWTLDADGITIHLSPSACNMLNASANPAIDATFACGTVIF